MTLVRSAMLVLGSWFVPGCIDGSSSVPGAPTITLLSADPSTFLGNVRCGVQDGLQRYVVSLRDVGPLLMEDTWTLVSGPTPCTEVASFTPTESKPSLNALEFYVAEIDGYDRDDVKPFDAPEASKRTMVDPLTGQAVPPRWTTRCGAYGDGGADVTPNPLEFPTQVLISVEVFLHGCRPFQAAAPADAGRDAGTTGGQPDAARELPRAGGNRK